MKKLILLLLLLPIGVRAQNQARMISGTNNITTCPYTIQKQDVTKLDVFLSSTACAVTLPAATVQGFGKGSIFSVKNNGTGSVTITPTGELIDGNASVTLLPGAGMDIYSTGTGYSSQPGSGSGGGGGGGINPPAGDIGGNAVVPLVISTHLNSPLPILQGGTGTQTPGSVAGTGMAITGSWPNETFSSISACWQNNGSALTCEPFTNAVPPLVATLNVGNSTIDLTCPTAVGVGGSHASGCVPDPGASGTTTDYLGRDMAYHTAVGASTILPDPATAIQYVAGTCNGGSACVDGNNGLSWGAAKLTISAALQALPGGSSTSTGSGTVFVGPGATMNAAGAQYGIWLMGSNDPNYASPPTGWLRGFGGSTAINIIGVPNATTGPNAHKPRVSINASGGGSDTTHPAVWLSGWNSSTNIQNLEFAYPGRVFVIGECSTGTRTDTCQSSAITFDNDGGVVNSAINTNGPCTDIVSGVFWVYFRDFSCGGMGSAASGGITANNAAGMLIDGTLDTGDGVSVTDSNFGGGGIKVIPGSNGFSLYASNITLEGNFTNPLPPVVWMTDYFAGCDARLDEINQADAGGGSMPVVENDGANYGNGVVAGPTVFNSQAPPQGPSTTINPRSAQLMTVDPLVYGSAGFFNKYIVGQTNVARRIGGLTPSRFLNKADANTAAWTTTNLAGVQTLTTGITDPFGGTGAATASSTAATAEYIQMGSCVAYTPAAGDWIVIGEWEKNVPLGDYFVGGCVNNAFPVMSATYKNRGMMQGNNNWEFIWTVYKVASGGATNIGIAQIFSNTVNPTVYGPVLYVIPAGTISDNEVIEFATTMNSIKGNCPVGSICNVSGHPVSADIFTERSTPAPTGTTGITQFYMDSTALWPSFKPNGNTAYLIPGLTGTITSGNNLCASGTSGAITTVGCTGGGGAGTVDAALQNSLAYYNTSGTVAHIGGSLGPTGPNSVPSFWVTIPSGSAATAPQPILAGIPGRTVSGASDTILVTDRVSTVTYTNAGATAVSLPGAGTTGFGSNFCFKMIVQGASDVVTITPAAGTINGGATQTVLQGQKALVCSFDNSNYIATIADPPAAAGSNIALTRGDASLSFASSAGGGTLTNAANSLPATQLICGNTYPDTLKCNLSGDASTAGSAVVTNTGLNGTPFTGTNGNVTGFGAANIPVDTGLVAANVITSTGTLLAGNVAAGTAAKNIGPTSIPTANLVTSTANSAGANQICSAVTTTKACLFTSLADLTPTTYAGVATNSGDNYSACPATNPATALSTNLTVSFKVSAANTTTTPTLNLCTLGAKTIVKAPGTSVVAANDMVTNAILTVKYDGTNMQLQNPQTTAAGGTALSSITAAAASNTIANGNFPQTWNSAQTTNSQAAFTHGETSAATAGTVTNNLANQSELKVSTASASTATPLSVVQGSVTGTTAFPAAQISTTWNNAGLIGQGLVISVTDTAHGTGAKLLNVFGGASGTTSLMSVDPSGNLTVGSCNGCGTSNAINNPSSGRWGLDAWSNALTGWINSGHFSNAHTCTTASTTNATVTQTSWRTCGTTATLNTVQNESLALFQDAFIGSTTNPTNFLVISTAKQSATTNTRFWAVELSDTVQGTLAISPGTGNTVGIRFFSDGVTTDTNFMLVLCNASTCTSTSTGVAGDTSSHQFKISLNDATGVATGCVDTTCITASTNYPASVAAHNVSVLLANPTATVETLSVSSIYASTIR